MKKLYDKRHDDKYFSNIRKTYLHVYDNCHHESLYWRYSIQETFEQLARIIRK